MVLTCIRLSADTILHILNQNLQSAIDIFINSLYLILAIYYIMSGLAEKIQSIAAEIGEIKYLDTHSLL